MNCSFSTILVLQSIVAALWSTTINGALAADISPSQKPTIGYFSLTTLQAKCTMFKAIEDLQERAEDQLRQDFERANAEIIQMQGSNRSSDEIKNAIDLKQSIIAAQKGAVDELIRTQKENALAKVQRLSGEIAKEHNLFLVFDLDELFIGGPYVLDHGIDLTDIMKTKLQTPEGSVK